MQIESYRESIRQSLKKYSDRGMRTAYAYGYLNSACSSAQYTREEIRELANIIDFELNAALTFC